MRKEDRGPRPARTQGDATYEGSVDSEERGPRTATSGDRGE